VSENVVKIVAVLRIFTSNDFIRESCDHTIPLQYYSTEEEEEGVFGFYSLYTIHELLFVWAFIEMAVAQYLFLGSQGFKGREDEDGL
jgi:hypothetical protein